MVLVCMTINGFGDIKHKTNENEGDGENKQCNSLGRNTD